MVVGENVKKERLELEDSAQGCGKEMGGVDDSGKGRRAKKKY